MTKITETILKFADGYALSAQEKDIVTSFFFDEIEMSEQTERLGQEEKIAIEKSNAGQPTTTAEPLYLIGWYDSVAEAERELSNISD